MRSQSQILGASTETVFFGADWAGGVNLHSTPIQFLLLKWFFSLISNYFPSSVTSFLEFKIVIYVVILYHISLFLIN